MIKSHDGPPAKWGVFRFLLFCLRIEQKMNFQIWGFTVSTVACTLWNFLQPFCLNCTKNPISRTNGVLVKVWEVYNNRRETTNLSMASLLFSSPWGVRFTLFCFICPADACGSSGYTWVLKTGFVTLLWEDEGELWIRVGQCLYWHFSHALERSTKREGQGEIRLKSVFFALSGNCLRLCIKNILKPYFCWQNTNFWETFCERQFSVVQTAFFSLFFWGFSIFCLQSGQRLAN